MPEGEVLALLQGVRGDTLEIQGNLDRNKRIADKRRRGVLRLRALGVPYKVIADFAGISDVYVYKIIKGPANVKSVERRAEKRRRARRADQ